MTERFIIDEYFEIGSVVIDTENENIRFKHENKLSMKQCCDLLNELNDKCVVLEIENKSLEDGATRYAKLYHESLKENEQLQQQNKKLQEKIKKERISFKKTQERYSKKVEAKIKELVKENENAKSILDDFIWILNVLQANPNDTKRLGVARDMLQNMGVLLYEK